MRLVLRLTSMLRSAARSVGCDQPSDFIDRQHVSIEVSGREQLRPNVFIHRPRSADELGPFSEDPLYFSPGLQVTKPELPVHSRPSIGLAQHLPGSDSPVSPCSPSTDNLDGKPSTLKGEQMAFPAEVARAPRW